MQRVFLQRRERVGTNWSLTSHFDNGPFEEYLLSLPDEKRVQCERIEAGFAFLLEPNGACIRSSHGDIIVISETLKEYLYFMNLFLMTQDESIPHEDTASALWIAVRTMMLTETPDFDLDPRGVPPEPLNAYCRLITYEQMQFVIGHEYAHHLLGHLGVRGNFIVGHNIFPGVGGPNEVVYSRSQQQEFDADIAALLDPELSDSQLAIRLHAASLFFLGLDIWHTVKDFIAPPITPSTHPPARDRLIRLRRAVRSVRDLDVEKIGTDEVICNNFDHFDRIKKTLRNQILPLEIENIEEYGSIYLQSFRPKRLRDRIDF